MKGEYGLNDLYIGVPAIVSNQGIDRIVEIDLNEGEKKQLQHSANVLNDALKAVCKP